MSIHVKTILNNSFYFRWRRLKRVWTKIQTRKFQSLAFTAFEYKSIEQSFSDLWEIWINLPTSQICFTEEQPISLVGHLLQQDRGTKTYKRYEVKWSIATLSKSNQFFFLHIYISISTHSRKLIQVITITALRHDLASC